MTSDRDWMLNPDRHCKGSSLFFPEDSHGVILAKAICMPPGGEPCPVLEECRRFAIEHHELFGVWGGLSQRERDRRRINHGTEGGYQHHAHDRELPCGDCCLAHDRWVQTQQDDERQKVSA